ncbi:hypothetical protein Tco_0411676 [Tanacetum coccineum]
MRILSVVSLKTYERYGYTFLKEIVLRRDDYKEYKISEADFKNLHPNDFENLDRNDQKKMMRETKVRKFSDGTLNGILDKLDHMVKDFKLFKFNLCMETRIWSEVDRRRSKEFMEVHIKMEMVTSCSGKDNFQDQERYEHVGPHDTRSQDGESPQVDDQRLDLADDLKEAQVHISIGSQEYQVVYTRLDIASADVGMLEKFDRGLQTHHIEVLSTTEAGYMTFTKAWKKEIWLKGLLIESGHELRLVAGIAIGALVKDCSRSEVPAQVKVVAYRY